MSPRDDWIDDLEFPTGAPWLRMGLSRIDARQWLIAEGGDDQLELRRRLLAERREDVVGCLEQAAPAVEELAALVGAHVGLDDDAFSWDPLGQIGAAVCEDFCVLLDSGAGPALVAAVVCFPSHWSLKEKMGGTMAEIHAPVPGYETDLASRVDTFMSRIDTGHLFARRNWTIQWGGGLFLPESREEVPAPSEESGPAYMRSERQTFRRLPESGAVVFTIRTQRAPLGELLDRPLVARGLRQWMERAPADLVAARGGPV